MLSGGDQISSVQKVILKTAPDVLLLNDFDWDYGGRALAVFIDQLAKQGLKYPYFYSSRPNAGLLAGTDFDEDGEIGGPGDVHGFGKFPGWQGMVLLSKYPIDESGAQDFSEFLWKDLPGAKLPQIGSSGKSINSRFSTQRLSSKGHWDIPVKLGEERVVHVLASHPTPPVFDGPEDENGLRNHDEIRFWQLYLDGKIKGERDGGAITGFVLMGDLNADPNDGEGSHNALTSLLSHPKVQDPQPGSHGAEIAAHSQGGPNIFHKSAAKFDTVDWDEARTPGNMRVDYVLPSTSLIVAGAGVFWPAPDEDGFDLIGSSGDRSSHHRLVWVDVR